MLGREVRLPVEVMYGTKTTSELNSCGEYASQLRDMMQHGHNVARKHLEKAAIRRKELHYVKDKLETYTPGNRVWFQTEMGQLKVAPKFRVTFQGPYLVTNAISESLYLIQLNKKGTGKVVYHNRLRPYRGNQKLSWDSDYCLVCYSRRCRIHTPSASGRMEPQQQLIIMPKIASRLWKPPIACKICQFVNRYPPYVEHHLRHRQHEKRVAEIGDDPHNIIWEPARNLQYLFRLVEDNGKEDEEKIKEKEAVKTGEKSK